MNDWWKMALGGAAGAGLLAATGGTAGLGLFGTGAAEAAAPAAAAGTAGGALAGEVGTGAISTGAGSTFGGIGALNGAGAAEGGALAAPTGAGMFVTPPVMGAPGALDGTLAGTSMGYGSPGALAQAGAMNTAPAPGLLAQAQGYAGQAGKAASAYGTVSHAMGGGQPQQQAPKAQPIFQGQAPQIAPQAAPMPQQGLLAQSGGNAGGMLRGIAQQRLGRRI